MKLFSWYVNSKTASLVESQTLEPNSPSLMWPTAQVSPNKRLIIKRLSTLNNRVVFVDKNTDTV